MTTGGLNVNGAVEFGGIARFLPEHLDIPPVNAVIAGASYGAGTMTVRTRAIPPLASVVVAGIVTSAVVPHVSVTGKQGRRTVEVAIHPVESNTGRCGAMQDTDLKAAYEKLREQIAAEGLPFLNNKELEREIAARKGARDVLNR